MASAAINNFAEKTSFSSIGTEERFMKDILGTLVVALLVMLSLITLLTADHNWESSNEPVVHNAKRVSNLGLRLALKSHQ
jgi:hypothetical protein